MRSSLFGGIEERGEGERGRREGKERGEGERGNKKNEEQEGEEEGGGEDGWRSGSESDIHVHNKILR